MEGYSKPWGVLNPWISYFRIVAVWIQHCLNFPFQPQTLWCGVLTFQLFLIFPISTFCLMISSFNLNPCGVGCWLSNLFFLFPISSFCLMISSFNLKPCGVPWVHEFPAVTFLNIYIYISLRGVFIRTFRQKHPAKSFCWRKKERNWKQKQTNQKLKDKFKKWEASDFFK